MTDLVQQAGIKLDATASSPEEAVDICGKLLVKLGAATSDYADAMWEREEIFPSAIGMGFAIPHGTDESRAHVIFDQLVFIRLAQPIEWADDEVTCILGIASKGDGHVELLGNVAEMIQDEDKLAILQNSDNPEEIAQLLLGND
jgi:PTS system mannitol-specific IIA component